MTTPQTAPDSGVSVSLDDILRELARRSGYRRNEMKTPAERSAIGRRGAAARWGKYKAERGD